VQKKALRNDPPQKRTKLQHKQNSMTDNQDPIPPQVNLRKVDISPQPKSILKQAKKTSKPSPDSRFGSSSPPPKVSRAARDKLAEDDEEIAALEKKLGLKRKKGLPQSFKDDGLDELLEGLDSDETLDGQNEKKRKAEGDEWLDRKRREARSTRTQDLTSDSLEAENELHSYSSAWGGTSDMSLDGPEFPDDESEDLSDMQNEDYLDTESDFDGFKDAEDNDSPAMRVRENPYVAGGGNISNKYIPPSLRKPSVSDSEDLNRLRRQVQGLVNRLTEANLISILGEIEKLYRDNARQHVTSTLVDLLLTSICEPTSLLDTFIILPAGFIAAIYKIIGTDFGAQAIQRSVELFDEHYVRANDTNNDGPAAPTSDSSKATSNLIVLLSEMYNFQVVGSNLLFDYIRLFLSKLSELNAELLLRVIRTSGPQLRQDDPSALKDIVAMLGPAAKKIGEENLSVRTKFMIESINDLKNNKMKTGSVASAVTSEHTIRMKKILGTLNTRAIKASEPLRIGLNDIQDSDKKGKWWLVGASWSGASVEDRNDSAVNHTTCGNRQEVGESGTSDLGQLAREHGMNTGIRVAIFTAIMSGTDYQDAYLRLMKLPLKKKQEYEIPRVLIICSGAEKNYNPYYTLIAKRICGDTKLKKSFQFSIWDLFKQMGESDDTEDDGDGDDSLDTRHIVNLAKMFGTLIADGGLSLVVLKNLNLNYLQPKTKIFMEVLFITVLLQSQKQSGPKRDEQAVVNIITRVKEAPHLISGMQVFLRKTVGKTDIAGGKEEKNTVKWACKVACDTLDALVAMDSV
jgi:nucleolar MIF4G domain-containing protein 1